MSDYPENMAEYEAMSTPDLREACGSFELEYPRTAKKDKLLKLINVYLNPPTEIGVFMKDVEKNMGEGVITRGDNIPLFTHVPIGSFLIDLAMAGGFAEGCGHMIYGYESCGKTTWWLLVAAAFQAKYPDDVVFWVDVEKKFDPMWAAKLGVDLDRIYVVKTKSGEHAVDVIEGAARSIEVCAIFLDSIPSLCPIRIVEKSAEDPTVAERARLVGIMCSKLQQAWIDEGLRGHKFSFFCINQFREKVGQMFGDPRILPGGRFQNYMVDSKLDLKCVEKFSSGGAEAIHTHNEHPFKFTKTKGAFSIKQGETKMVMNDVDRIDGLWTGCFDDHVTVATYAKRRGLITGGGASWFIHGVEAGRGVRRKFNSVDDMETFLKGAPEEFMRLKQLLIMIQRRESRLTDIPPDGFLLEWLDDGVAEQYGQVLDSLGFGDEE